MAEKSPSNEMSSLASEIMAQWNKKGKLPTGKKGLRLAACVLACDPKRGKRNK